MYRVTKKTKTPKTTTAATVTTSTTKTTKNEGLYSKNSINQTKEGGSLSKPASHPVIQPVAATGHRHTLTYTRRFSPIHF